MVSCLKGAWHCHGKNHTHIGIELIGYGKDYQPAQVTAARQVLQALITKYQLPMEECNKDHKYYDPTRKVDCGPEWGATHLPKILSEVTGR
jgi:N-acetyl-anhydromuramyl-L-alanine amidase AmpD